MGSTQEMTINYRAGTADQESGGVQINIFRGTAATASADVFRHVRRPRLQSTNYTPELKAAGLRAPDEIKRIYDFNPPAGGPILRDKLWFFTSAGWWRTRITWPGCSATSTPAIRRVDLRAGPTRQGFNSPDARERQHRLTWQATPKNKFSGFYDYQWRCWCARQLANLSPESASTYTFPIENMGSFSWSSPMTSRLLLDASISHRGERFVVQQPPEGDVVSDLDSGHRAVHRSAVPGVGTAVATQPFIANTTSPTSAQASLTFVTGTHALKLGFTDTGADACDYDSPATVGVTYRFNTVNGVTTPIRLRNMRRRYTQQRKPEREPGRLRAGQVDAVSGSR